MIGLCLRLRVIYCKVNNFFGYPSCQPDNTRLAHIVGSMVLSKACGLA